MYFTFNLCILYFAIIFIFIHCINLITVSMLMYIFFYYYFCFLFFLLLIIIIFFHVNLPCYPLTLVLVSQPFYILSALILINLYYFILCIYEFILYHCFYHCFPNHFFLAKVIFCLSNFNFHFAMHLFYKHFAINFYIIQFLYYPEFLGLPRSKLSPCSFTEKKYKI